VFCIYENKTSFLMSQVSRFNYYLVTSNILLEVNISVFQGCEKVTHQCCQIHLVHRWLVTVFFSNTTIFGNKMNKTRIFVQSAV